MLTVCCFLWSDPKSKWRDAYTYGPQHVLSLREMLARHLSQPHEVVCVTDGSHELPADIRTVPIDEALCIRGRRYQKLMIWKPDAAEWLGERILMLDLDVVITGSLDSLVDRDEDVVMWANPAWPGRQHSRAKYNTTAVLLTAGARPNVFNHWDAEIGPGIVQGSGFAGTDQVWASMVLGGDEATWTQRDGVYSWSKHVRHRGLPRDAVLVAFHGRVSPCQRAIRKAHPWVKEHYPL